jgi:CheY-like chemotaxis protein
MLLLSDEEEITEMNAEIRFTAHQRVPAGRSGRSVAMKTMESIESDAETLTLSQRLSRLSNHVDPRLTRILLAEDDTELRHLLTTLFRRDGHEVVEAQSGHEFLERIAENLDEEGRLQELDLIISDIRLPGLSGLDVLASLHTAGCQVPVILITAFGDDTTHTHARKLGAAAFFDKPFDVDDLRLAVHRLIEAA